jgi:hypothetical protein
MTTVKGRADAPAGCKMRGGWLRGGGFGLAGPDASTEDEVQRLLGTPFEHIQIERLANQILPPWCWISLLCWRWAISLIWREMNFGSRASASLT